MREAILNNTFAFITAIVAIIALIQTQVQIKISNKQFLFKERVEKYLSYRNMYRLYEDNKALLDFKTQ